MNYTEHCSDTTNDTLMIEALESSNFTAANLTLVHSVCQKAESRMAFADYLFFFAYNFFFCLYITYNNLYTYDTVFYIIAVSCFGGLLIYLPKLQNSFLGSLSLLQGSLKQRKQRFFTSFAFNLRTPSIYLLKGLSDQKKSFGNKAYNSKAL